MSSNRLGVLLSIAGFDPSASAGILADAEVFSYFGFKPIALPTCMTIQDQHGVELIQPLEPQLIKTGIERMLASFDVLGIKIGLVPNEATAQAIASALETFEGEVVLDPVLVSTTGSVLTENNAAYWIHKQLLPLTTVLTPNKAEFERLFENFSAPKVFNEYPRLKGVLITGFTHNDFPKDLLITQTEQIPITCTSRVGLTREVHGTGCHHSSALLALLLKGHPIDEAACKAQRFLSMVLKRATANYGGKMDLILPLCRRLEDEG